MLERERERERTKTLFLPRRQTTAAHHLPFLFLSLSQYLQNQKKVLVLLVVALGMVGQINSPWQVSKDGREERREDKSSPSFSLGFFSKRVRFPEKTHLFLSFPVAFSHKKKQNFLWAFLAYGPVLMLTVLVHELGHCFASRSVGARVHGELSCFIFFLFFPFEVVRRKWRGKKTHLFPSPPPSTKRDRNPPLAPRRPRLRRPLVLALQGPLGRGRRPPDAPSTARVLDGRRGRVVRRLWSWTALDQVEGVAAVEQRLARAGDVCGKRRFFFLSAKERRA